MTRKDKKKIQGDSGRQAKSLKQKKPESDDPFAEGQAVVIDPLFLSAFDGFSPQQYRAHKKRDAGLLPVQPSSKKQQSAAATEVDLHGCLLREALATIDRVITSLLKLPKGQRPSEGTVLKVITGKGRHSGVDGGVLIKEVYSHVVTVYRKSIVRIDNPPAKDMLHGLPLRGFFMVTIR